MKKRLLKTMTAALVAATIGLSGCGGAPSTPSAQGETNKTSENSTAENTGAGTEDNSLQQVLDAGTFILGLDATFKPMGFTDEKNEIVGFDIDVAEAVCKKLGVELVKEPVNWETKEQDLSLGKVDCIWNGLSINASREKEMNLSEPYMKNDMVFVVASDSDIQAKEDMKGKTIAVQNGSTAQEILEESDLAGEITVQALATNVEALQQLDLGLVDAVFMDSVVAEYENKNSEKGYIILNEGLYAEEYAIGFRKEDQKLRDEVQKVLSELKADGTLAEISGKWFGSDITTVK